MPRAPRFILSRRPSATSTRASVSIAPAARAAAVTLTALASLTGLGLSGSVQAAYPEKPITVIISFPPAGATDVMARAVGQTLSAELGQSVIVENRAGAGGMIGLGAAARAQPDGYTLYLAAVTNQAIADTLYTKKSASLIDDFVPVGGVGYAPHALVVPVSLQVGSVPELVAYLKANPGQYNFASQGTGTLSHLESELFAQKTDVTLQHIPYKGSSQALPELVTGSSSMMFDSITGSLSLVQAGKLKMLAVASRERLSALPDVPTVAEAGVPGFEANNVFGFVAPKGTPPEAIATLESALQKTLASTALREKLAAQGADLRFITAKDFGAVIVSEHETWKKVVKDAGVSVQ